MGFISSARKNSNNNAAAGNDKWKSVSFINVYLPSADGTRRRKLGAIPLNDGRPFEAAVHERLASDPEALKAMVALLQFDFQVVETEVKADDLPF